MVRACRMKKRHGTIQHAYTIKRRLYRTVMQCCRYEQGSAVGDERRCGRHLHEPSDGTARFSAPAWLHFSHSASQHSQAQYLKFNHLNSMSQPEQYATCIDLITIGTRTKLSVFSLHDGPSLSHNIATIRGFISIANKPTVACYKANPSGHYLLYPVYTCTIPQVHVGLWSTSRSYCMLTEQSAPSSIPSML